MPEAETAVPGFYPRLRLEPGRELAMFPARLNEVLALEEEIGQQQWAQRLASLDDLYARHGAAAAADHFAAAIAAEGAATRSADEEVEVKTIGPVGFVSKAVTEGAGDAVGDIHTQARYYGFGSESDFMGYVQWESRSHVKALMRLLLEECRRSASVAVPASWTPSTLLVSAVNEYWGCDIRDGLAIYRGLVTDRYRDLMDFARTLLSPVPEPWLLESNGPDWDQAEASEQAAFVVFDTLREYLYGERYTQAVDALRVLALAGWRHPRVGDAVEELLTHAQPALRDAAAGVALAGAEDEPICVTLPASQVEFLVELTCCETVRCVAEKLVHMLRLNGGEKGFAALLAVAERATLPCARDAAARALAWLPGCPKRLEELKKLARSQRRVTARVAMKAMNEAKHHGLFSREGEFASRMERDIHAAMKKFFGSGGGDEEARTLLDYAFESGFIRLEIEGEIGAADCAVTVMSFQDVPIVDELVHTREFCGLLERLDHVKLGGAHLTDNELERERLLRVHLGGSMANLKPEQQLKIGAALAVVEAKDRATITNSVNELISRRDNGELMADLILSLESAAQIDAFILILEALPEVAAGVQNLLVKGPGSGTNERLAAFQASCPNLQTYWGYLDTFPENAAEHMGRFIDIREMPGRFGRDQLADLDGAQDIVLWSAVLGYQPPP